MLLTANPAYQQQRYITSFYCTFIGHAPEIVQNCDPHRVLDPELFCRERDQHGKHLENHKGECMDEETNIHNRFI